MTQTEIERFLKIIEDHPSRQAPEFTGTEKDHRVDPALEAELLVRKFRMRFRALMDPKIQGAVWQRNPEWAKLFQRHKISSGEFAALVGSISCAVTSVRIEKRLDVDGLVAKAQQRVEKLVDKIERIDRLPQSAKTKEIKFGRTHAVVQLGQSVALWEFAETLKLVPAENRALVRRYSKSLKPLLVANGTIDPLVELKEWEKEDFGVPQPVQHASGRRE